MITARAAQARERATRSSARSDSLAATKQQKLVALSELSAQERAEAAEIDALQARRAPSSPRRSAPPRRSAARRRRRDAVRRPA